MNIAQAGILKVGYGKQTYQKVELEYDVDSVIHEIDSLHYPASEEIKKIFTACIKLLQ